MTGHVSSYFRRVVIFNLVFFSPYLFLILMIAVTKAFPPLSPPDDAMIALLTERRATFDLLVTKVREERLAGTIGRRTMIGGRNDDKEWAGEVRELMRVAGISEIHYEGPDLRMILTYSSSGLFANVRYKDFIYYPSPIIPPPVVADLHGEDGPDVVRAVLCDRNRRADLDYLCRTQPRVNDLDIIARYADGDDWEAERPIDEHWSLRLWHIQ